jgi:hypothetical protein
MNKTEPNYPVIILIIFLIWGYAFHTESVKDLKSVVEWQDETIQKQTQLLKFYNLMYQTENRESPINPPIYYFNNDNKRTIKKVQI